MKKAKKYTLFSLIPFAASIYFYLFSFAVLLVPMLVNNADNDFFFGMFLFGALALFISAPQIAIACNTAVIVLQGKAMKRSKNLLWLNVLLIVLASLIIIASIVVLITFILMRF
jgi:hypothetical protein